MAGKLDTLLNAARGAVKRGDYPAAQAAYVEALCLFPANQRVRAAMQALEAQLGAVYQTLSPPPEALSALIGLIEQGDSGAALELAERLLAAFPQSFFLHNLAGAVHAELGAHDLAAASHAAAIALKPDYADAHYNLGNAQDELGETAAALASYDRALAINPGHAEAHHNRAKLLQTAKQIDAAIAGFESAIACDPAHGEARLGLASALSWQARHDEALGAVEALLAREPDREDARMLRLNEAARVCDWSRPEDRAVLETFGITGEGGSPFAPLVLEDEPARALVRARKFADGIAAKAAAAPLPPLTAPLASAERTRIGFFSADFHDHATMYLMSGLFRELDRTRFEVHAYSFGGVREGARRGTVASAVDGFHDVLDRDDAAVVALARSHGLDIAVDLKGYTRDARTELFAHRMAPVQVNYLGYPGTTGAPFIDYIIADAQLIPTAARGHYSEQVVWLPGTYQPNDNQRVISPSAGTRAEHGLPTSGFVFACFNHTYKIGPDEFDVWCRLLGAVEGSVLWLLRSNTASEANLRREAAARGVDAARLVFAPKLAHEAHLARLRHADLFLDTFACNAHTTASDALWAGLPVLTTPGQGFAARVASSLVLAAGLPELVTESRGAYEQAALELARDPARLGALRARLAANRMTCALFDTAGHTRALEAAFAAMTARYRAGLPPADITLA